MKSLPFPDDTHYVIFGASGWLGQSALHFLEKILGDNSITNFTAYGSYSREIKLLSGRKVNLLSTAEIKDTLTDQPVVVLHYAFGTKDKVDFSEIDNYHDKNHGIRDAVYKFVGLHNVIGMMMPSSGAVYDFLQQPDMKNEHIIYGGAKYADETFFSELARDHKFKLVLPRVFNVSGSYINKPELYALSSLIISCLRNEKIDIHANHPVWRSYYSAQDLLVLSLNLLNDIKFQDVISFDTVGTEVVEVGELAQRVINVLDEKNRQVIRPHVLHEPNNYYVGNPENIRAYEKEYKIVPSGLDEQILATANYLKGLL